MVALRSAVLGCMTALVGLVLPALAQAQFPPADNNRPVRIVVPYDAGTGPDILARTLGQKLAEKWKVAVVVDNRPGASTAIGTMHVAKSPPDGYTLMVMANTLVLNRSLKPNSPPDPVKDFTAVAPLAIGSLTLVTHPELPVKSVKELVAMSKANPGKLDYASPHNGTPHHLTMELFKRQTGADLRHIPYSTTGGAVQGIVGGQVQAMFLPIHVALPLIQGGRLNVLASGGLRRSDATPDIPSLTEALDGQKIDGDIWFGMYAPADTPKAIVDSINKDVNATLESPEIKAAFAKQGLIANGGTPEEMATTTRDSLATWLEIVRAANIKVD